MAKRTKPLKFNRVYCFFALFCTVYFLESIGGVYMVSAIQSIERQFQIPSKMSGLMISAGDFGYIPTVAITSYMGSKGNRARWIGGGCLLIAGANFMISTPNFIFRAPVLEPNLTKIAELLSPPVSLTYDNVTAEELLNYTLINEKIPEDVRKQWINNISQIQTSPKLRVRRDVTDPDLQDVELTTLLFERLFSEVTTPDPRFREMEYTSSEAPTDKDTEELETAAKMIIDGQNITESFVYLKDIIKRRYIKAAEEARREAVAPFGYCSAVVNTLRKVIADMKCERDYTNTGPFLIIFMALFFLGIGRTMPWSLGVPLIDDNVKRKNLPVYFAGMFFIRILGPILGFSIGSVCNRIYFNLNPPEGLSPRDPTWIGAWWLGFMVISAVLFGPSLALFCFPNPESKSSDSDSESNDNDIDPEPAFDGEKKNRVPQKKRKRELALVDRHVRKTEDGRTLVPTSPQEKIIDFFNSVYEVLKSPIYTGALIGRILDVLAFKGFMVFLPKYLENHYGIPQYQVHMYMALFGVVGFAIGMLSGSFVMRKFKLEGRNAALFVAICSALAVIISSCKIFLGCHSVVNSVGLAGANTSYNYTTLCNSDCFCDPVKLFPVCDIEGNPYYSPCHAGCTNYDSKTFDSKNTTELDGKAAAKLANEMNFTDCTCTKFGTVVNREWCKDDCKEMIVIYFALVIVAGICGGLGVIPGVLIILRAVPPAHRSISLGFSGFLVSLCATLPSPVIWGYIIDNACLVWERTCTGADGSCTIYEPNTLRTSMHVFYGILRSLALLLDVWVWYHAKDLKLMTEDDDKEAGENANNEEKEALKMSVVHDATLAAVESQESDDLPRKLTL